MTKQRIVDSINQGLIQYIPGYDGSYVYTYTATARATTGAQITLMQFAGRMIFAQEPVNTSFILQDDGGVLTGVRADGIDMAGASLSPSDERVQYGQAVVTWTSGDYFFRIIPNDVAGTDLLRLCYHMETPVVKRLTCLHHRPGDNEVVGVDITDDVAGTLTTYSGSRAVY